MNQHRKYKYLNSFLYKLYGINNTRVRKTIIRTVSRLEGGDFYSETLRKIFLEYHQINIGMYSYGCFSLENVSPGATIGRYCSFASKFSILSGNHPMNFKSLHPFFYNPSLGYVNNLLINRTKIVIGNDVWVGQNATILPSVHHIADGAVVGAGSIVSRDVPPFAIVVGNPAKIIKYRFSEKKINDVMQSSWWDKSIEVLNENQFEFESFIKPFEIG